VESDGGTNILSVYISAIFLNILISTVYSRCMLESNVDISFLLLSNNSNFRSFKLKIIFVKIKFIILFLCLNTYQ